MAEKPIEVKHITCGYPGRTVLEDVSFSVERGSILTILGTSGCGKSTLLKHLCGLLRPLKGEILIDGEDIASADETRYRSICARFGVAFQSGALFRSLTLAENVALPLEERTTLSAGQIKKRVMEKLSLVNLEDFADYMPSELSGGMIKRCAFARAMALDPAILFFDEPSAGLDPVSSEALDMLILDIRRKTNATIVVVTHELASIFTISDRSIMLSAESKSVIADGSPVYLRENSSNEAVKAFLNRGKVKTETK